MSETIVGKKRIFEGRIFTLDVLDVEVNGMRHVREVVYHPPAVVVLARLPDGRFVLVRQFRAAVNRMMIEAVAGLIEPGEDPAASAERELREEIGYSAAKLVPLGSFFASPGCMNEELFTFFAELEPEKAPLDGDPDEDTEAVFFTEEEMVNSIRNHEISDAKTLAAWAAWREQGAKR
jgi:ADP-ribose pyrophosphatase